MDCRQRKDGVPGPWPMGGHEMTAMRGRPPTFDNDAALGVHQGEKLEKRFGHVAGWRVVAPRRVWVLMTEAGPFGVEQAGVEAENGAVPQVVSSGLGPQVWGKAGQLGAAFGQFLVGSAIRPSVSAPIGICAVTSAPPSIPHFPSPSRWNPTQPNLTTKHPTNGCVGPPSLAVLPTTTQSAPVHAPRLLK